MNYYFVRSTVDQRSLGLQYCYYLPSVWTLDYKRIFTYCNLSRDLTCKPWISNRTGEFFLHTVIHSHFPVMQCRCFVLCGRSIVEPILHYLTNVVCDGSGVKKCRMHGNFPAKERRYGKSFVGIECTVCMENCNKSTKEKKAENK